MKPINEIAWRQEFQVGKDEKSRTRFEFIVKENGKIIYYNYGYAGVLSIVEEIQGANIETGEMEGITQKLVFGHPIVILFAFDQLRIYLKPIIKKAKHSLENMLLKHGGIDALKHIANKFKKHAN